MIVKATLQHIQLIAPLLDAYRVFYGQAADLDGASAFLTNRLTRGDSVILLAIDETESAGLGFAQLYPSFSTVSMQPIWILNDLFVSDRARRQGVARRLIDAVAKYAAQTGAVRVDLATAKDNAAAKALYEQTGYALDKHFDHYKLFVQPSNHA